MKDIDRSLIRQYNEARSRAAMLAEAYEKSEQAAERKASKFGAIPAEVQNELIAQYDELCIARRAVADLRIRIKRAEGSN